MTGHDIMTNHGLVRDTCTPVKYFIGTDVRIYCEKKKKHTRTVYVNGYGTIPNHGMKRDTCYTVRQHIK